MDDDSIEHGLARLFAEVWGAFIDGPSIIDGADIEAMLLTTGLVEWRRATEVEAFKADIEAGDPILALTEDGKRVRDAGRA